jgi:lipoprotein-anchoring transpeptidase ErfK/SrfK
MTPRPHRILAALLCLSASVAQGQSTNAAKPKVAAISEKATNLQITKFPARIPAEGPLTLQIEVLLDRANYSPGIIDGAWGRNAAKAMAFFTAPDDNARLNGETPAPVTTIDKATYERLLKAAGPGAILTRYTLESHDVAGPFADIPALVYDQAKLKCLCYGSAVEALAEKFHTSPVLLARLNPSVKMTSLRAGTTLLVPKIRDPFAASPTDTAIIARVIISKTGFWLHAVDAAGKIIYHFPSTLGAGYDPSPTGDFRVSYVSRDPAFHYQPKLFAEVPDDQPEARLPAGPNSPVGVVWIGLSKPHYGIHGTSSPQTIGYANSHGCVRLTNWDALKLSDLVEPGVPVQFK